MASMTLNPIQYQAPVARLVGDSLAYKAVAILIGSLILYLSARITVPMLPVPMTMQTYAVLVVAALGGRTIGLGAIVAYLMQGALGLPVFAQGFAAAAFLGTTGGFLIGFALIGWIVAEGVERGYARSLLGASVLMLVAHFLVFVPGVAWLSTFVGLQKAIALGFGPFIIGTFVKSALAVATLIAAQRYLKRA